MRLRRVAARIRLCAIQVQRVDKSQEVGQEPRRRRFLPSTEHADAGEEIVEAGRKFLEADGEGRVD